MDKIKEELEMGYKEHAIKEFEYAGWLKDGKYNDNMQELMCTQVLELLDKFAEHGHSGSSAPYALNLFNKLAKFKPITNLTFQNSEWGESYSNGDNTEHYQNKRNSSVFKDGEDGKPYFIDAHIQKNQTVICWSGSIETSKGYIKKCYIKDSANMPIIYLDIYDWEVNKEDESIKEPGSGWWLSKLKDETQLEELEKYYDVEYIDG